MIFFSEAAIYILWQPQLKTSLNTTVLTNEGQFSNGFSILETWHLHGNVSSWTEHGNVRWTAREQFGIQSRNRLLRLKDQVVKYANVWGQQRFPEKLMVTQKYLFVTEMRIKQETSTLQRRVWSPVILEFRRTLKLIDNRFWTGRRKCFTQWAIML